MAYSDFLFQLGMDSQGSSTTQKKDYFIMDSDGVKYAGNHIIIDLYDAKRLDDIDHMDKVMREIVDKCGATLIHLHLHHFTPFAGISGVAVLSESHISVHTWPERGFAAFDVFMCGSAKPEKAISILQQRFDCSSAIVKTLKRGYPEQGQQVI